MLNNHRARKQALAGAVTFGLALSFAACATATQAVAATANSGDATNVAASLSASTIAALADSSSVVNRWREYAMADLTPEFSWADPAVAKAQPPSALDNFSINEGSSTSSALLWHDEAMRTDVRLRISSDTLNSNRGYGSSSVRGSLLPDTAAGDVQRNFVAPTLEQRWGAQGIWGVSGILAYQRHTSPGFGTYEFSGETNYPSSRSAAYGAGMSLGIGNVLFSDALRWSAGFRSKIVVDDYYHALGVYAQPGIYDLPSSYRFGLAYALTVNNSLDLRAEHVQYSDVTPYVGSAPPSRIGAAGATGSLYAQRDLSIYSLGWTWHAGDYGDWQLRYSSREQPLPASDALYQALKYRLSNYSMSLSYAKPIGHDAEFRLAASYAPTEYLFGVPYGISSRNGGNQSELEALYVLRF